MAELKPVPSIEEAVEELANDAFPIAPFVAADYRNRCREALRSLIPIVRREAMRECAEIARDHENPYDHCDCGKQIASAIEQRMEGQMSEKTELKSVKAWAVVTKRGKINPDTVTGHKKIAKGMHVKKWDERVIPVLITPFKPEGQ